MVLGQCGPGTVLTNKMVIMLGQPPTTHARARGRGGHVTDKPFPGRAWVATDFKW